MKSQMNDYMPKYLKDQSLQMGTHLIKQEVCSESSYFCKVLIDIDASTNNALASYICLSINLLI